jgi:hypothetical protein
MRQTQGESSEQEQGLKGRLAGSEPMAQQEDSEARWAQIDQVAPHKADKVKRYVPGVLATVSAVGLWVAAIASGRLGDPLITGLLGLGFALAALAALWAFNRGSAKLLERRRRYWAGGPADGTLEWSVTLDVVQDNVPTGRDYGRIWVQDRSICFVGTQTSFVLSRWQLSGGFAVRLQGSPLRPIKRSVEVELAPLGDVENWSLQIDPDEPTAASLLAAALAEVARDPNPFELGQFPPRELGPERCQRSWLHGAVLKAPFPLGQVGGVGALMVPVLAVSMLARLGALSKIALFAFLALWVANALPRVLLARRALRNYRKVIGRVDAAPLPRVREGAE